MHLKFLDVLKKASVQLLRQIAQLCEQYQCVSIVAPWVQGWISPDDHPGYDQSALLVIAWAFGDQELFEGVARNLVRFLSYDKDGHPQDLADERVEQPLPPGILGIILSVRNEAINAAVSVPFSQLARYEAAVPPRGPVQLVCQVQVERDHRLACDALSHGRLIRSLMSNGIYQKSTDELVTMPDTDLENVAAILDDLKLQLNPGHNLVGPGGDHSACSTIDYRQERIKIMYNLRSPVLDSHIEHMRTQRTKLGFMKVENMPEE
ncbi:hypothetical protein ONS95_010846 [Cadophora gregata]|uniref:uncharacterized protein n=1 Tax=Cadophora gregata TaxID=51156 RepID=UPI0026DD1122|nr:uncharacterized protein ONS95_010846 [Cadophora gregata]KAK0119394.1 hypothetical protein ONS95_010846 [Cadophora gregata]